MRYVLLFLALILPVQSHTDPDFVFAFSIHLKPLDSSKDMKYSFQQTIRQPRGLLSDKGNIISLMTIHHMLNKMLENTDKKFDLTKLNSDKNIVNNLLGSDPFFNFSIWFTRSLDGRIIENSIKSFQPMMLLPIGIFSKEIESISLNVMNCLIEKMLQNMKVLYDYPIVIQEIAYTFNSLNLDIKNAHFIPQDGENGNTIDIPDSLNIANVQLGRIQQRDGFNYEGWINADDKTPFVDSNGFVKGMWQNRLTKEYYDFVQLISMHRA